MRANRRRDTGPERQLRSLLHAAGLRFRVDLPIVISGRRPLRPDIVFTRAKLAIFIDGCFWHGCPAHGRRPKIQNGKYWGSKIARNIERDQEQAEALAGAGWTVLRFWEHDQPEAAAAEIKRVYRDLASVRS
jgi:DNA mismatch endonuclease (patch repair protein)